MIVQWLLFYVSIAFAMCVDNTFWITDSPEWNSIKKNFWLIKLGNFEYPIAKNKEGWSYVTKDRVWVVIKSWRDIVPAVISSSILTLIWSIL